jgi:hypothetical protein
MEARQRQRFETLFLIGIRIKTGTAIRMDKKPE